MTPIVRPWHRLMVRIWMATLLCGLFVAARLGAADSAAGSNFPPRLVVAVLPFQNATGDAALDAWPLAFPGLIRSCLGNAEFVTAPGWKKVQRALDRAGWTATNTVDAALARQVARDLRAQVAIWGQFRRESNGWAVDARLLRIGPETSPEPLSATAVGWVDLAESVALRVASQLGRRLADDDLTFWRMNLPHNERATECLGKMMFLKISEAPVAQQEAACRAVLAADPRCGAAYVSLLEILFDEHRESDAEQAIKEFRDRMPGVCLSHLARALSLMGSGLDVEAEAELLEASRLHRGCPDSARLLARVLAPEMRWGELAEILKPALARRPDAEITRILLAHALAQAGDRDAAREVLEPIEDWPELPEGSTAEELALCQVASAVGREGLAGQALLRLSAKAQTNNFVRTWLNAPVTFTSERPNSDPPVTRPRSFTSAELSAELERRLTAEERRLVVNPVEITPELRAEARRLTANITNEWLRAMTLFAEVAQRGRGLGDGGQRTASESLKDSANPETRFSCQEHAKLFVAFARALGLNAWLAHIERCADGSPGYHDCAALFVEGQGILVDPTWGVFGILHQEFTVLDDLQTISHQAMQPGPTPDPRRLRMGLKLYPEDRWTRLRFVSGMARAGELEVASDALRKIQASGVETWDTHEVAAELEIARRRWKPALAELQQALTLSPSNAIVHFKLSLVYAELADLPESKVHLETAVRLNRGEFSREARRESQTQIAFLTAVTEGQSDAPAVRDAVRRRAEAGDLPAQMAMAKQCLDAEPPRAEEGMRWLLKAAEQGNELAQFNYACYLLKFRGADAAGEIVKWLGASAGQGNDDAQYRLGLVLYEGKLADRDYVSAAKWVYLAADKNHAEARRLLDELKIFLSASELAEARKQANAFKPAKPRAAKP